MGFDAIVLGDTMLNKIILIAILVGLSSCSMFFHKKNVIESDSGLMWKPCPEGLSGDKCNEGKAEKLTWHVSMVKYGTKTTSAEGYDDWRLPTAAELKTLMRCETGKPPKFPGTCNQKSPAIDVNKFPNVENYPHYWSASEHNLMSGHSNHAWAASFNNGFIYSTVKDSAHHVRLVRGHRSRFKYPDDAERNGNRHIGPFCCTGETLTIRGKNNTKLGYVYFFGWGGQAYNTNKGAVFPSMEILVAGVRGEQDGSLHKTRILIPASEDSLKKRFHVKVGCVSYVFSDVKAKLTPYKNTLYFSGFPKSINIDVNTDQCHAYSKR